MNKIKLFEIFVYPQSEEQYYKKWQSSKEIYIEHQIKTGCSSYEDAFESFKRAYDDVYWWNYNKMCGVIIIYYDSITNDIRYDIYKQNHNLFNKKVTLRLKQIFGPNLHDYIGNLSNDEIVPIIDSRLKYIKKNFFKNNYIDLNCYNNLKHYVDFNSINKGSD